METSTHPQMAALLVKIDALQQSLLAHDSKMPDHLKAVHRTLIQYEELSHLLSEEQIATILEGAQKKLGLILAAETTATKGSKGKSLKDIGADDL